MKPEDAEEYTQALGQVVAGGWRQVALGERLGVPKALGLTVRQWVDGRLGGYVKQSVKERREAVDELSAEGMSSRQIAGVLGVDHKTVVNDRHAGEKSPTKDEPAVQVEQSSGEDSPRPLDAVAALAGDRAAAAKAAAKEAAAEKTKARRERSRSAEPLPDGAERRIGDAREVLADVPDSSVALILTDPPYGDEARPLYEWLGQWAARVLVPGGSLICYTGQSRLDLDLLSLGQHLRYWWLLSMPHTKVQRLPGKFVMAEFKPVLWYVKDHRRGRALVNDVLRSKRPDKSEHDWGQGEAGVSLLIEQLTEPDELIADPFAGSELWGKIAANMGRRWIGADQADDYTAGVAT